MTTQAREAALDGAMRDIQERAGQFGEARDSRKPQRVSSANTPAR